MTRQSLRAIKALRVHAIAAVALIVVSSFTAAFADEAWPDPTLTPGAVRTTDRAEICAPGYDKAHRVWRSKLLTLQRYGIPENRIEDYEDDDLIPVCLGGDNASPLNHWPQPWAEADRKDEIEAEMCARVCAGEMTVEEGEAFFRDGKWTTQK
jgi:hypothetical protein